MGPTLEGQTWQGSGWQNGPQVICGAGEGGGDQSSPEHVYTRTEGELRGWAGDRMGAPNAGPLTRSRRAQDPALGSGGSCGRHRWAPVFQKLGSVAAAAVPAADSGVPSGLPQGKALSIPSPRCLCRPPSGGWAFCPSSQLTN